MEHAGMFDYILSSEQISFFNGCVSQRKAELWTGICFSTPSPGPLAAPRDTCLFWVYLRWPGSLRGRPVLNSHAGPRCPVRLSFPNKTCLRILGARSRPCVEQRWHFTDRVVPPARLLSSGWTASISWTQSPSLSPLLLFHWVPLCVFFFDSPPPRYSSSSSSFLNRPTPDFHVCIHLSTLSLEATLLDVHCVFQHVHAIVQRRDSSSRPWPPAIVTGPGGSVPYLVALLFYGKGFLLTWNQVFWGTEDEHFNTCSILAIT